MVNFNANSPTILEQTQSSHLFVHDCETFAKLLSEKYRFAKIFDFDRTIGKFLFLAKRSRNYCPKSTDLQRSSTLIVRLASFFSKNSFSDFCQFALSSFQNLEGKLTYCAKLLKQCIA